MRKLFLAIAITVTGSIPFTSWSQCSVDAGNDVTLYLGYPPAECATLTANASGQGTITYSWNTGDTTASITVCDTADAMYIVTITDTSGCVASDTVMVTVINISCDPNGHKVYVCHIPPGNPSSAHTICIGIPAVQAHLGHGDFLGPCDPIPPPVDSCSVDLGPDVAICDSGQATFDAGPGYASYLWSDSSTGQTLSVDTVGTFWVVVTDSAGCVASDTVETTDDPLMVDLGSDQTVHCPDSCATLEPSVSNGTPPFTYLWNTGDTASAITVRDSGMVTYTVAIVDANGCEGADTIEVNFANGCGPHKVLICHVPPGNPSAAHSKCIGKPALKAHLAHGDELGCCEDQFAGGPRHHGIIINPNPARQKVSLRLTLEEPGDVMIDIYSIDGRHVLSVFSGEVAGQGFLPDVDLREQAEGLYVVTVRTQNGPHYSEKFLLVK